MPDDNQGKRGLQIYKNKAGLPSLGLRLETICRCIAHLRNHALVEIIGRDVKILNIDGLNCLVAGHHLHLEWI